MSLLRLFGIEKNANSVHQIPIRIRKLFAAKELDIALAPLLVKNLRFSDLSSNEKLLAALTPDLIRAIANLFGVRVEWLLGLDSLIYDTHWCKYEPRNLLRVLSEVVAVNQKTNTEAPSLRFLTSSLRLNRHSEDLQWIVPVVVEIVDKVSEQLVSRCHVFGNFYDWRNEPFRIEAKAIAITAWKAWRKPIPMYLATPEQIEAVLMGGAIPPLPMQGGFLPDSCLEDYILSPQENLQAKEVDELPKLLAYLDMSGLSNWRPEVSSPLSSSDITPSNQATQDANPASLAKPDAPQGKREAQEENWGAILAAAQTIWAEQPRTTYAEVIRRLKAMPHLKAVALSDSAIQKRLQPIAPPEVRGKPGRKPK